MCYSPIASDEYKIAISLHVQAVSAGVVVVVVCIQGQTKDSRQWHTASAAALNGTSNYKNYRLGSYCRNCMQQ
jgi:hypothetical protein